MASGDLADNVVAHRFTLKADDGHNILTDLWQPPDNAETVAVVQLSHGLGEHSARYERFAQVCARSGIAIAVHNHRGHGESCPAEERGHFADSEGWDKVIGDVTQVRDYLSQFADVPLVMMGHSMGSFIAQSSLMRDRRNVTALILSGSTWSPLTKVWPGRMLARFEFLKDGARTRGERLNELGFGSHNRAFAPNRTPYDWLSRDNAEVDKYLNDPACGGSYTNQLWHDLLGGIIEITSGRALRRIPANLPILITGGADDPVGGQTGLTRLAKQYRDAGHTDVQLKIYPDGRHEMLNETNRDEVMADIVGWLLSRL